MEKEKRRRTLSSHEITAVFSPSQVTVFEEQNTDGRIQFTTVPDLGKTVEVQ